MDRVHVLGTVLDSTGICGYAYAYTCACTYVGTMLASECVCGYAYAYARAYVHAYAYAGTMPVMFVPMRVRSHNVCASAIALPMPMSA